MRNNGRLNKAKREKNDEFYTLLSDIEKELKHYTKHLYGKKIYCNCDDYETSNFVKYFKDNFKPLGLVSLTATCYIPQGQGKCLRMDENGSEAYLLEGDGDFRSEECIEMLKECDIVITNPPFSLFREYITQLVEYDKKLLIIGNVNAITYKEVFPLIKDNKLWVGYKFNGKAMRFKVPSDYETNGWIVEKDEEGNTLIGVGGVGWYTNLEHDKRYKELELTKRYNEDEYPMYDNYDAINVNRVYDIPMDYYGAIGVPITFIEKYCPSQFEIIGTTDRGGDGYLEDIKKEHTNHHTPLVNGKGVYKRMIIRRKRYGKNEENA